MTIRTTCHPLRGCPLLLVVALILASGCEEDERLARLAEDATARQAEQNQEMIRLNREVNASHQRLLEADAQARQASIALQQELVTRDAQGREELNALARADASGRSRRTRTPRRAPGGARNRAPPARHRARA